MWYFKPELMLSHQSIFQSGIFLSVALSNPSYMLVFEPSSSSSKLFFMLFLHLKFLLCFFHFHILFQNCFVSFVFDWCIDIEHSPPNCQQNFLLLLLSLLFLSVITPWTSPFFTIFSHQLLTSLSQKNESFYKIYTPSIQYLVYTNQILLSNSSDSSKKYSLKFFFLSFFSKIIQFNLKVFHTIAALDLIWQFVPKVYYSISNLVFEICLDSKFSVQGKILKKCLLSLEIPLFWKFQLDQLWFFFWVK